MATAKISQIGWIVIPAEHRRKYRLKTGDRVDIVDYGGILAILPTPKNPVEAARGLLKGETSLTKVLLDEREKEASMRETKSQFSSSIVMRCSLYWVRNLVKVESQSYY